jgi:uncharacterized protein (DUF1501 family)
MQRREFIQKLPFLSAIPFSLSGVPFKILSNQNHPIFKEKKYGDSQNVLIILQLHGGNDGLNTVIPLAEYDQYYNFRPNLAIPDSGKRALIKLDSTLGANQQIGLHPDMIGMKQLYDRGRLCIVEGVSYPNANGSHFRGRDIMFMGGGSEDHYSNGWIGRYIEAELAEEGYEYPDDFVTDPNNFAYKDPLALEFGNEVSLIFHQKERIPTSISIGGPEEFYDLVKIELDGYKDTETDDRGIPPLALQDSPYYNELSWILGLEERSNPYAERMKQAYDNGLRQNSPVKYPTTYPLSAPAGSRNNPLQENFKIIANLIGGGLETRVFLVRIGGFDTHANQVEKYDPTMGAHAALLYHISATMKAFQEDLQFRNVEHRVLTVTTTEFGRRVYSNFSFGSDHGEAAPMFLFGNQVKPGFLGNNALFKITNGNLGMQHDYRKVYASILEKWMGMDKTTVDTKVFLSDFEGKTEDALPIINDNLTGIDDFKNERFFLRNCFPNPASDFTTIAFKINAPGKIRLKIVDTQGKVLKDILNEDKDTGDYEVKVDVSDLKSGTYLYQFESSYLKAVKKLIVLR